MASPGVSSSDIAVVSAVDEGFLPYVGVVAVSMAHFAAPASSIHYHVLYSGPDNADAKALDRFCIGPVDVRLRPAPTGLEQFGTRFHLSPATLLRLQLAEELRELDRACYLDADVLVRADIAPLFHTALGGALVAGVPDYTLISRAFCGAMAPIDTARVTMGAYLEQTIGLPRAEWGEYVSAALLVMNLEGLRQADFLARAAALLDEKNDQLRWRDQDVINILTRGRKHVLAPGWNVAATSRRDRDVSGLPADLARGMRAQRRDQRILHYAGANKPWARTSLVPRTGEWWHFARLSPTWATIEQRYNAMLSARGALRNPLISLATSLAGRKYARAGDRHT